MILILCVHSTNISSVKLYMSNAGQIPVHSAMIFIYDTETCKIGLPGPSWTVWVVQSVCGRLLYRGRVSASCTKGPVFESCEERVLPLGFFQTHGTNTGQLTSIQEAIKHD